MKDLEKTACDLVAAGKGILSVDESPLTLTRRFGSRLIDSTPDGRRAYRDVFLAAPGIATVLSGACLHDETIRQSSATGLAFPDLLARHGVIAGIKVDHGLKPWAESSGEHITEGLDGLPDRLREYGVLGARFAKWRAAIAVSDGRPSATCLRDNAQAVARYAAICQQRDIVPVVAPEVLMDGSHTIERCEDVTASVLFAVFRELVDHKINLESMVLMATMVAPGTTCADQAPAEAVAAATIRCLRRHVPAAVPGIAFCCGGQDPLLATTRLNAINQLAGRTPWALTFAFGRALQEEALTAWGGWPDRVEAARRAFLHRATLVAAAARGRYSPDMEAEPTVA